MVSELEQEQQGQRGQRGQRGQQWQQEQQEQQEQGGCTLHIAGILASALELAQDNFAERESILLMDGDVSILARYKANRRESWKRHDVPGENTHVRQDPKFGMATLDMPGG